MERYGLSECFIKFWKSKAVERTIDPDIFRYYCEKSGIEKVFWGAQPTSRLAQICKEECPYYKQAIERAYSNISNSGGNNKDDDN